MAAFIDQLSPRLVGEDRLTLKLSQSTTTPKQFDAVTIDVDTTRADNDGGLVLPLELHVVDPTGLPTRRTISRSVPASVTFFPQMGGQHLVLLRERNHNRWHGKLLVAVEGDDPIEA